MRLFNRLGGKKNGTTKWKDSNFPANNSFRSQSDFLTARYRVCGWGLSFKGPVIVWKNLLGVVFPLYCRGGEKMSKISSFFVFTIQSWMLKIKKKQSDQKCRKAGKGRVELIQIISFVCSSYFYSLQFAPPLSSLLMIAPCFYVSRIYTMDLYLIELLLRYRQVICLFPYIAVNLFPFYVCER